MVEAPRPAVSIVIVNWNTADLLTACLDSVRASVSLPHEVLVVDNASTDRSVETVRERFPEVRLFPQVENLGYPRGNNVALEQARGEQVLLLNPDTVVRAGAVEALVGFLAETPGAGIVGPPLFNPDGSPQESALLSPTLGTELLRQTMLHRILPSRHRREVRRRDTREVDAVTGAALCIRRTCLEAIGPLDERIFMFYEDMDWCLRARRAGWEVWYAEGPGIDHVKAAASARHARARTLLDSQRSTVYFFRKHHGAGSVAALRGIAFIGSLLRGARAAVLWLAGRDRADQRERLRAYGEMLRWSLLGGELR